MHDSRRYRYNAAACLLAAQQAPEARYRWLRISMASSWLSLARQDEATDDLAGDAPAVALVCRPSQDRMSAPDDIAKPKRAHPLPVD
jgi:hypothetical protein